MSKREKKIQEWEQDNLVVELCTGFESMEEDEFEEKYNQLDKYHQMEVDEASEDFADAAIGDPHWREGTDHES